MQRDCAITALIRSRRYLLTKSRAYKPTIRLNLFKYKTSILTTLYYPKCYYLKAFSTSTCYTTKNFLT